MTTLPTHPSKLKRIFETRRGLLLSISAHDVGVLMGINEPDNRTVRRYIDELIDFGFCIGSVPKEGGGCFIPTTERELELAKGDCLGRAEKLVTKARKLDENFRNGPPQTDLPGTTP